MRLPNGACILSEVLRQFQFAVVFVACAAAACKAPEDYAQQIAGRRAEIEQFMHSSPDSPIPADKRASFPPLAYYPIDASYRVPAALKPEPGDEIIQLSTSTGQPRRMRRVGVLAFTLKGQTLSLIAFGDLEDPGLRRLFVPFADLTSGTETYPGGRYLDLDRTASGVYDLDFNRAYHPYCVFNPTYECPLPPRENRLKVPIRAGEKLR
jgi:uncharacterized protein (DUF1684 family)